MSCDGSVPQGWVRAIMQDVASIVGGGTPSTTNPAFWSRGDIPWITPADLSGYEQKTISRGARNITRLGLRRSAARLLPAGTVLFSSRAPIGYVAIASNPVSTNQGFKNFVLETGISPDYMYYYLQFAKPIALSLASGTTFQEISGRKAQVIPVVVAPAAEQSRIVGVIESHLSRLDAAVASLERVQAKLKAYRASVLKAAVEGRLVPTEASLARAEKRVYEPAEVLLARILKERRRRWEATELARLRTAGKAPRDDKWKAKYHEPVAVDTSTLPELPEGWCWLPTDALAFVTKLAGFEYTKSVQYDDTGDLSVIKAENAGRNGFKETNFSRVRSETVAKLTRSRLEVGDLLMVFVGAGTGNVARVPGDRSYFLGPNIAMIRVTTPAVSAAYLEYYLRSPLGNRLALGFSKAVAQESLSMGTIRKIPVAVPPLAEQDRIVAGLDYHMSVQGALTGHTRIECVRLARLRQSILKWAFEGKLVDQDPTDEPAERLLARIRAERAVVSPPRKTLGRRARGAA